MSDEYIKKESRTFIEIADDLNDLVTELNDKIVETIKEKNADVAPVRHGHWIFNGEGMSLTCSDCGVKYNIDNADGGLDFMENAKYCISCGTKMDEVEDDEA